MDPRLKSSKKWTRLPKELLEQIVGVVSETFKKPLAGQKVIAEGRIYQAELLLRVGHLEPGRLQQANFEVSIEFDPKKENALKLIHTGLDAIGSMLQQYFDGLDLQEFPWEWQSFELNKKTLHLRVSTVNTDLEAEADRLLAVASDEMLVEGEDQDVEEQAVYEMLGLNDDDEEGGGHTTH
ncbi:MAG: hypothetical protein H6626_03755 [Pseudobdellovibrionaceae bacterium]|nr:hypothetical protein [Bdellovibrionales bacterium]USN48213.1 MAG: hypothetical protein H6626_03755 [Pseudobdellovibrionaceae bacterium]